MIFKPSATATELLTGLKGIEIGGSAHNPFGLDTLNVSLPTEGTIYSKEQKSLAGVVLPVDIEADASDLPFCEGRWDFVISSHVLEHIYNPIEAIKEWLRVVHNEGYVFMIIPDKRRTFDRNTPRTTFAELQERDHSRCINKGDYGHVNFWILEDLLEICREYNWDVIMSNACDDKVGNGFMLCIQKHSLLRTGEK